MPLHRVLVLMPFVLAALAKCVHSAQCPPANFTSAQNFSLDKYIARPWFSVQQAVNSYQSRDQLFCVRAEYKRDPSDASRLQVFNQGRRGSVSGPLQGTNMLLSAIVKVRTADREWSHRAGAQRREACAMPPARPREVQVHDVMPAFFPNPAALPRSAG